MTFSDRTGPVGRIVRVGFAIVFALTLASIVDARGPARFRDPHVLTEPSVWVLHLVAVIVFVIQAGALGAALGRSPGRAQAIAIGALAAIGGLAAVAGLASRGAVWGYPLADVVWTFDVAMSITQLAAFGLAAALGTPGCEIGVWSEIVARLKGDPAPRTAALPCVIGIDQIDRWEARRRSPPGGAMQ